MTERLRHTLRNNIAAIIEKNLKGPRELLESFNGFEDLSTAEVASHIETWKTNPSPLRLARRRSRNSST